MIIIGWLFFLAQVLEPCPFCDKNILERQTVYHGTHASVLVTHQPVEQGHLLVIPNRHVQMFHELNAEEILEMGLLLKKVNAVVERLYGGKEYLLLEKNGSHAGQSVPHVHIHFLPRYEETGQLNFLYHLLTASWWKPESPDELRTLVSKVSKEFEALEPKN